MRKLILEVNAGSRLVRVGGGTDFGKKKYPCDVTYKDVKNNFYGFKATAKAYSNLPDECRIDDLTNTAGVHFVRFDGNCTLHDLAVS